MHDHLRNKVPVCVECSPILTRCLFDPAKTLSTTFHALCMPTKCLSSKKQMITACLYGLVESSPILTGRKIICSSQKLSTNFFLSFLCVGEMSVDQMAFDQKTWDRMPSLAPIDKEDIVYCMLSA